MKLYTTEFTRCRVLMNDNPHAKYCLGKVYLFMDDIELAKELAESYDMDLHHFIAELIHEAAENG